MPFKLQDLNKTSNKQEHKKKTPVTSNNQSTKCTKKESILKLAIKMAKSHIKLDPLEYH